MSGSADRHDRTEAPTPKRLEEARREGRVPRSRELTAAAVLLTAGIVLVHRGDALGGQLGELMRGGLSISRAEVFDESAMLRTFSRLTLSGLYAIVPVLLATLVAALAAPLAIGGWAPSGKAITPDFTRLSPVAGMGRMFSLRSWVELG
jgi:flagellar biosynthetic protein FlhB